jgi:hypothetical protein
MRFHDGSIGWIVQRLVLPIRVERSLAAVPHRNWAESMAPIASPQAKHLVGGALRPLGKGSGCWSSPGQSVGRAHAYNEP